MSTAANVIRIEGVYYDSAKLAAIHPGGELFVLISNNRDGTTLFNSSHRRAFPHDKYKAYQIPASKINAAKFPEAPPTQDFGLYWEICEKVKPHVPLSGFAPWHYFVKVAALILAYASLEMYFLAYGRSLGLSIAAGVVSAFIGLNVQHDANHGAVSRNPLVNRVLGFTQDLIGGSGLNWMIGHDTIHHVHCNDIGRDHDLDIPMLRLHSKVPWQVTFSIQQLYIWVLEAVFGVVHVLTSALKTIQGPDEDQKIFSSYWNTHRLLLAFNAFRIGANLYLHPSLHTAQMIAVYYMAGGLYLAFFFFISHNFDGAKKEGIDTHSGCFVRNQVETSSNVGGFLLAQLNGGLNYQIEHHLFPRLHHSNYHRIAPIVRSVCEKHGVQYVHFPTIWDNVASCFEHVRSLGSKPM